MTRWSAKSLLARRSPQRCWLIVGVVLVAATSAHHVRASDSDLDLGGPSAPQEPDRSEAPTSVVEAGTRSSYPLELGGRVGYTSAPIRGGVNPFATGVGARIGYVISDVYLGATAIYDLGGSDVGATDQAILFGAEVGYGVHIGEFITLRPTVGVGDAALSHTEPLAHPTVDVVTTASGSSSSSTRNSVTTTIHNVYIQPGLTTMLASRAHFFALTASALVVPGITYGPAPAQSTTWISYSFEGQLGFRF
jgi:hypothetical protein